MKIAMSMAEIDRKSDLIAKRVKDQEPGPTMALAFLARGIYALIQIGMSPENIEQAAHHFIRRYRGRRSSIVMPSSDELKDVVVDVLKKH